jgi:hypothetical protein
LPEERLAAVTVGAATEHATEHAREHVEELP